MSGPAARELAMNVSLITTVKNEAGSAAALIDAVARQTRPPDEWIVVDGGSTDGTEKLFSAATRCRVIRAPGNIAHGRNVAIDLATASVVAVTDAGCRPAPDWLASLVKPLESDRADIAAGATRPRVRSPLDAAQWSLLDQFVLPSASPRLPSVSSRSLAFRREIWAQIPYPEWLDHGEDTWAIREWTRRGWRLERVPQAMVRWQLRDSPKAFFAQHFRYMRGDGRAGLHGRRHLLRFAFYGALLAPLFWPGARPAAALGPAGIWLIYLAANVPRLLPLTAGRGLRFTLRSLTWMPLLLLGMDGTKMAGYLRGRLDAVLGSGRP